MGTPPATQTKIPFALGLLFLVVSCRNAGGPIPVEDRISGFLEDGAARPLLLQDHQELRTYLLDFPRRLYDLKPTANGFSYFIDRSPRLDGIKQVISQGGVWEGYFVEIMAGHIKPGTSAVDAGAFIGTHSLAMSRLTGPGGRVYAFEPQKKVFRELVYNLIENDVRNVIPLRFALGEANRVIEMDKPVDGLEGLVKVGQGGDPVELRTLDSFRLEDVSFLKIDVEGYEDAVLEGARRTIADNGNPPVLIEKVGERRLLESYGYTVKPVEPRDFLALPAPPYELGWVISFARAGNAEKYKSGWWSAAEDWGAWSIGDAAHLVLPLPGIPGDDLILSGVVKAFVNAKNPRQEVEVLVNGRHVDRWVFLDGSLQHVEVRIPAPFLKDYAIKPLLLVTFEIKNPVSPAALGLSGDKRTLGLGVQELTVREL
jgi:FkbM family methyltransferase